MASTHRYLPSPPSQVGESAGLRLLTLIESGSVPIEDYIPRATDYDHQRRITGVTSSRSHTKKHPKDHVARPGNAFLQFRSDFIRTEILPRDIERNNAVLSKITAAIWRKMPISRRTPWMLKAEREKEEHMLRYPDYQYGPSRSNPSTKKDKNRPNCSGTLLRAHKSKKVVRPLSPLIYPPLPMLPEANAAPVEPYPHNDVEPTSGQRQSSSYSLPRAPEATSVLPSCTNLFTIDASWNLHSNGQSHQQFRTDFSNVWLYFPTLPYLIRTFLG
ncbi:hypothetical protein DL96DRAFT_424213 [Flagelloscypha sp. PMI_526]|nr:hypothetical protein DL96DRAFT_424213 [Flagelloscypha sp. PMI_526]